MSARLIPPSSELTQPYWRAARADELAVQFCQHCDQHSFPPRAHCPQCGSAELEWRTVSGRGSVYTFTIAYRPPHPVFSEHCPMVIAVIELEEGPRMISNIVGCDPATVEIGMAVQVAFEEIEDSKVTLPVFTPVKTS
ncbi:MAG: Zn-ribbon domain-containing OB-fold protein [Proteobacteria bacterium]|nr:Zn-ribbon domain-containing OB-fold protein [Pseudomonadota bacterium]